MASADSFYAAETSDPVTDWQDYSNYYDEYDDDEEVMLPSLLSSTRPGRNSVHTMQSKPAEAAQQIVPILQLG